MKGISVQPRPNIQYLADHRAQLALPSNTDDIIFMNSGECPFNAPCNRHPRAENLAVLKQAFATDKHVRTEAVLLAAGSFSPIDLFMRTFCTPERDNVVLAVPAPEAYTQIGLLNGVECREVRLGQNFDIEVSRFMAVVNRFTKAVLLCSPNYPTGSVLSRREVLHLAQRLNIPLIVDETFIDFSSEETLLTAFSSCPNLIIVGSLSAAFAAASLEVGYAIAHPDTIRYMEVAQSVQPLATPVVEQATALLSRRRYDVDKWVQQVVDEREKVVAAIKLLPYCEQVFPSATNFVLARFTNAQDVYSYLKRQSIIVADVSSQAGCENCLNITIGLKHDNNALISALRKYTPE